MKDSFPVNPYRQPTSELGAAQIASHYFAIDIDDGHSETVAVISKTYPDGWLFIQQSRAYIEQKDEDARLRGGGQLIVLNDGRSFALGSGMSMSIALESKTADEATAAILAQHPPVNTD